MIGRRYIHKSLGKEKSVAKGKNWPNFVKIKFNIIVVMLNYHIRPVFFGFFLETSLHVAHHATMNCVALQRYVDALNVPGWRLHSLLGDRQEYWFLTVSGNCCITFKFIDTDVYVVNYEDYH